MLKNSFSMFNIPIYVKLVFVLLFCLTAVCGCGDGGFATKSPVVPKETPPEDPPRIPLIPPPGVDFNDTELGKRIKQDYFDDARKHDPAYMSDYSINDVQAYYYGTYNDCVAVMIRASWEPVIPTVWETIVGETIFLYSNSGPVIIIWKGGRFYELMDAYDQKWLTVLDIRNISYNIYGRDYVEDNNLENHAGLLRNTADSIRISYYNTVLYPYFPEAGLLDAQIEKYYGSYEYRKSPYSRMGSTNDCVAVMITTPHDEYADEAWDTTIAGTLFRYSNGNRILLWKMGIDPDEMFSGIVGRFYELQDAYDMGLLSDDDIKSIAYYHETETALSYNNY